LRLSDGIVSATTAGFRLAIHLSKSTRAACRRASNFVFTLPISALSASKRGRSAAAGTVMMGGVSLMLPSIAFWVVLLKKAAIS
jgi:hypothetical protein